MVEIEWLGHASFKITGKNKVIYIDPYNIKKNNVADLILITHAHFDHCSPDDVDKINGPETIIACPGDCEPRLMGHIEKIRPFEKKEFAGVRVEGVPAYNLNKSFHPKANGWLGYVLEVDNIRIYHAGDTDLIPEMAGLKGIDYALLPIGGIYTMNAVEAAKAADIIKPKLAAMPMHYGTIAGDSTDAEKFKNLCSCRVKIH